MEGEWWNTVLDSKDVTLAEMRKIIKNHHVGSICKRFCPEIPSEELATIKKLKVLIVGHTGAGKSSVLISCLTALETNGVIQWWRGPVASPAKKVPQPTTPDTTAYFISMAGGEKGDLLELIDTRGAMDMDHYQEFIQLAVGNRSSQMRNGEFSHYEHMVKTEGKYHAVIVVVSATVSDSILEGYKQMVYEFQLHKFPYVTVITHTDKEDHNRVLGALNLAPTQVIDLIPYNQTNNTYNDTTNKKSLEILLHAILKADGAGLPYRRVSSKAIWTHKFSQFISKSFKDINLTSVIFTSILIVFFGIVFSFLLRVLK